MPPSTLAGFLLSASGGAFIALGPILKLDHALLNAANSTIFQVNGGTVVINGQ